MEISGISSSFPFIFQNGEKEAAEKILQSAQDVVDVQAPHLLADDEVDGVLEETINMITQNRAAALSVHSGLTESRVFALLGY